MGNWKLEIGGASQVYLVCEECLRKPLVGFGACRFGPVHQNWIITVRCNLCSGISEPGNSKTFRFLGLHESTDCRERRTPETRKFGKLAATTAIAAVAGTCSGAALAVASQQMRTMRRAIVERRR